MIRGLALVLTLPLAACALIRPAAEIAGELVREACEEPRDVRELVIASINTHAAPQSIAIHCQGDPN